MNAFLVKRRQAERFAQLLDERQGGTRHHVRTEHDPELAGLLPLVDGLNTVVGRDSNPSADFKRDLHAMLMATIERDGIGATAAPAPVAEPVRPARGRRVRLAAIVGIAAGTLTVSSMSMASGDSNPGDVLYGVKRSTEKAQLALAGTDISRGQLYLQFARTRMAEALTVAQNPDALGRVLNDMDTETQQGVRLLTSAAVDRRDAAALDSVESFVTDQRSGVSDLLAQVSGDKSRAATSLALLDDVQTRSASLRSTLTCANPAGSVLDELGPIPQRCSGGQGSDSDNGDQPSGTSPRTGSDAPATTPSTAPNTLPTEEGLLDDLPLVGTSPHSSTDPVRQDNDGGGLLDGVGKILGGIFG